MLVEPGAEVADAPLELPAWELPEPPLVACPEDDEEDAAPLELELEEVFSSPGTALLQPATREKQKPVTTSALQDMRFITPTSSPMGATPRLESLDTAGRHNGNLVACRSQFSAGAGAGWPGSPRARPGAGDPQAPPTTRPGPGGSPGPNTPAQ